MKITDATITSLSLVAAPTCHGCAGPMVYLRGATWVCRSRGCTMLGKAIVTGVAVFPVADARAKYAKLIADGWKKY